MGHPDEAGFLSAIAAGDDTARLVFADWLDEHGDPRAPWVRDPELWPFMAPDATDPVPRLLARVGGEVPNERWELLGRLGAHAVPALVDAHRDENEGRPGAVVTGAVQALGWIGAGAHEAVPTLVDALSEYEDEQMRKCAASALGSIGPTAVPALVAALRDEDGWLREGAAWALRLIGAGAHEAVPALAAALGAKDVRVSNAAVSALAWIGPAAVPALTAALRDEWLRMRGNAAWALGWIGPGAHEAGPALTAALRDEHGGLRACVAQALGRIGPGAAEAVPELERLREVDPDQDVRRLAAEALASITRTE